MASVGRRSDGRHGDRRTSSRFRVSRPYSRRQTLLQCALRAEVRLSGRLLPQAVSAGGLSTEIVLPGYVLPKTVPARLLRAAVVPAGRLLSEAMPEDPATLRLSGILPVSAAGGLLSER